MSLASNIDLFLKIFQLKKFTCMIFFVCLFFTAAGLIYGSFSRSIEEAFESGCFLNTGNPECFFAGLEKHFDCSCK